MGLINESIQRKSAFFHSLGKVLTEQNNSIGKENYKSSHNIKSSDVWLNEISFCASYNDAVVEAGTNSAVTIIGSELSPAILYPLAESNYQTWFLDTGTPSVNITGCIPSDGWVKPFINPADVQSAAGAPSNGFVFRLFRPDGSAGDASYYDNTYWDVDYYSGLLKFEPQRTPGDPDSNSNLGYQTPQLDPTNTASITTLRTFLDANGPKAVAFQYTGQYLSNIDFNNIGGAVDFEDSDTISFTQSVDGTYSAFIKPDSISVSELKTDTNFSATAGYILSNDGSGNFQWVEGVSVFYQNTDIIPTTVGGIEAGSSFSTPTSIQNVLDQLLYPELFPTLTAPSSTFTSTVTGLREIGEIISTITFNSSFNRGSINPQYQSIEPFRSGLPNSYEYIGTDVIGTYSSTSLTDSQVITNYTVLSGAQSWQGRVNYDAGVQPKTNKGNDYDSPLPAGSTNFITRTITGVYPFFATSVNITTLTKQALAAHNSTFFEFDLQADSGTDKQTFELPQAFSAITGVQQYSTVSFQWDWIGGSKAASLNVLNTQFTKTSITKTINSNSVPYYQYVYNGSTIGFRQIRLYTN